MNCEKCGKEIPENQTFCPDCGEAETVLEQVEETVVPVEETVAENAVCEETSEDTRITLVVRKKRGVARVILGILSLVIAVALVVLSLWPSVCLLGRWGAEQTTPTGYTADLQIESRFDFSTPGKLVLSEKLLNYEELGYAKENSEITDQFTYTFVEGHLELTLIPKEGQEAPQTPIIMYYRATPTTFSYWQNDGMPRQVFDYSREGFMYPSMYLWIAALVLLILGVLLLAIPCKKRKITVDEATLEGKKNKILNVLMEKVSNEIQSIPQDMIPEGVLEETVLEDAITEETVLEETAETTDETNE